MGIGKTREKKESRKPGSTRVAPDGRPDALEKFVELPPGPWGAYRIGLW